LIYLCQSKSTAILYDTDDKRKTCASQRQTSLLDLLRRRQVYQKQAALKKGSSIEYVSENRVFTDADDYSVEIELPLADCPQNLDIFGMITRKNVDAGDIFFDALLKK